MEDAFCSFCGKSHTQVKRLVSSPTSTCYICDSCVEICRDIVLEAEQKNRGSVYQFGLPNPMEIKAYLDDYIVGQERAKRAMAVAVYNHYKRLKYNLGKKQKSVVLDKSNILLIGPTGVGKTLIAKTLAQILKVPFVCVDATSLTEAGYVGDDVESILSKLLINADYDVKKAEIGIIYIDEIDKIARKVDSRNMTRDVSGEGVQQALLKILEGATVEVSVGNGKKSSHADTVTMNTNNILFICGGAFVRLDEIIFNRNNSNTLGFSRQKEEKQGNESVTLEDLVNYGMIPEFVGRLPVVITLEKIDKVGMMNILTTPKNNLVDQYKTIFMLDGIDLEFKNDALEAIASRALSLGMGARGLRNILEDVMLDTMYSSPSAEGLEKIVIDKDCINKKAKPQLKFKKTNQHSSKSIKKQKN